MRCRICGREYNPIQTREKLTSNWSYDGTICFECAEKQLLQQNDDEETRQSLTSHEIGRTFKETISKRIKMLESLLEQQPLNSKKEIIDELITLCEYQDIPPEEVANDLWVKENIEKWCE